LSLKADHPATLDSLALILISHPDPNVRNVTEAVELAERAAGLTNHHSAGILNTLSTAYAAAGRFEDAIATAQEALTLASADKNQELANHLRRQLDIYASHKSR
jgi:tetratricopeptide (TPR) repeat protein